MSKDFNWKHLICAQIIIDKLSFEIEQEIVSKSLRGKN